MFDFYVEPYIDEKPAGELFTHENIINDFKEYKVDSKEFWNLIDIIYKENRLERNPPELDGIPPRIFLLTLKWIWIQEDFNYRLFYGKDIQSPIPYKLITRRDGIILSAPMKGRKMLYEALLEAKEGATSVEIISKYIQKYK